MSTIDCVSELKTRADIVKVVRKTQGRSIGHLFAPEREEEDPDHVYSDWHLLPDLLLEKIYQYITIRERYYASQVCWNWYRVFNFPRVWYTFVLHDELLTKRKFNLYTGWQKILDHIRCTVFVTKLGSHIRTLIFKPMNNLFNLYEFLNICFFLYIQMPGVLEKVTTLRFHFSCHQEHRSEEIVYGTGGQILSMLKRVLGILTALKTLELTNLLLDGSEGPELLDEVCYLCAETLEHLILINITKLSYTLLHPGAFVNLKSLIISPQSIGEDLLELIGNMKLRNLHIVQNKYTETGRSLHYRAWKNCRQGNRHLRVHLRIEGKCNKHIIWQPRAPVKSIVYDTPYSRVSTPIMLQLTEQYGQELEVFAHTQLPRFHMESTFHERPDSSLLLLARQCPYLHTLMIREKISTATVLLLAYTAKNLYRFYVRKNSIILKCDWPFNPDWTEDFYCWLRKASRSYISMEQEVSQILGHRWQALTDKQFKMVDLDLNKPLYMYS